MTDKVSLVFVNLHYAILRYINIYRLKMDRDSLLLFHFMYQRFRDAKKRRALNRRRRRMYLKHATLADASDDNNIASYRDRQSGQPKS